MEDAQVLKQAFKGFGCNEEEIINIITKRSNEQRQEIAKQFKTMYGKVSNLNYSKTSKLNFAYLTL